MHGGEVELFSRQTVSQYKPRSTCLSVCQAAVISTSEAKEHGYLNVKYSAGVFWEQVALCMFDLCGRCLGHNNERRRSRQPETILYGWCIVPPGAVALKVLVTLVSHKTRRLQDYAQPRAAVKLSNHCVGSRTIPHSDNSPLDNSPLDNSPFGQFPTP